MKTRSLIAVFVGVLIVLTATGSPATAQAPEAVDPGPITIEIRDAPLSEVLGSMAQMGGKRVAVEAGVALDVKVTIQAQDMEWHELFERVLHISGFGYEEAGVWLIVYRKK